MARPDTVGLGRALVARFGYLRSLDRASAYEQSCSAQSDWGKGPGETLMFVRDSPLAVVFKNGRTTAYVLMKGC